MFSCLITKIQTLLFNCICKARSPNYIVSGEGMQLNISGTVHPLVTNSVENKPSCRFTEVMDGQGQDGPSIKILFVFYGSSLKTHWINSSEFICLTMLFLHFFICIPVSYHIRICVASVLKASPHLSLLLRCMLSSLLQLDDTQQLSLCL